MQGCTAEIFKCHQIRVTYAPKLLFTESRDVADFAESDWAHLTRYSAAWVVTGELSTNIRKVSQCPCWKSMLAPSTFTIGTHNKDQSWQAVWLDKIPPVICAPPRMEKETVAETGAVRERYVEDTPLLINIKGCGYPPTIVCDDYAETYSNYSLVTASCLVCVTACTVWCGRTEQPSPATTPRWTRGSYCPSTARTRRSLAPSWWHCYQQTVTVQVINIAYSLLIPNLLFLVSLVVLVYWYCPYCQARCRHYERTDEADLEWGEVRWCSLIAVSMSKSKSPMKTVTPCCVMWCPPNDLPWPGLKSALFQLGEEEQWQQMETFTASSVFHSTHHDAWRLWWWWWTITELHRQVQSVRLLLGTCDNQKSIPSILIHCSICPQFSSLSITMVNLSI